ncbi:MAG: hypothetical protein AAF388_09295 [Bacteroidota bacterium]
MPSQYTEFLPAAVLAFSNGEKEDGTYLEVLDDERDAIGRIFRNSKLIIREQIDRPLVADIARAFDKYHRYACIFHYSGHAFGEGLSLKDVEGKERTAFVSGTASLVNFYKKVKLVFLNGCSTRKQINFFQDTPNPPVVIATTRPVRDEVAAYFSEAFYESFVSQGMSVQASYEKAKGLLEANFGDPKQIYRTLIFDKKSLEEDAFDPYILESKDKTLLHKTLKDWKEEIGRLGGSQSQEIAEDAYLSCNRYTQCQDFKEALEELLDAEKAYPLGVFIQGPSEERGHKLIERFVSHEIPGLLSTHPATSGVEAVWFEIDFPKAVDFEREREKSKRASRKPFQGPMKVLMDNLRKETGCFDATDLLEAQGSQSLICLEHRIQLQNWEADMKGFIQHYLEEVWANVLEGSSPRLIVFFNLTYLKSEKGLGKFLPIFSSEHKKVDNAFQQIHMQLSDSTVILEKLQAVPAGEIDDWISDKLRDEPTLFQDRFSKQKSWSMARIEKILTEVIKGIRQRALQQEKATVPV